MSVATNLYRIAQKAVANAVSHGQPHLLEIHLFATGTRLVLTVADDGSGLPPEREWGTGLGIRMMRYRCDLMGAELDLTPASDLGGTLNAC